MQISNSATKIAPNSLAAMQQRSEYSSYRCRTAAAAVPRFSSRALPHWQRSWQRFYDIILRKESFHSQIEGAYKYVMMSFRALSLTGWFFNSPIQTFHTFCSSHKFIIHLTHRRFEDEGAHRGYEEFVEAFQWVLSFLPLVSLFLICVTNSILGSQCEPL